MSTLERKPTVNQQEVHTTSPVSYELIDNEERVRLGAPLLVERSSGDISVMYASPTKPVDQEGNPMDGYVEVVGVQPESIHDAYGNRRTHTDGSPVIDGNGEYVELMLASKIVPVAEIGNERQQELASAEDSRLKNLGYEDGFSLTLFRDSFPENPDLLLEYFEKAHARKVGKGLLDVIQRQEGR